MINKNGVNEIVESNNIFTKIYWIFDNNRMRVIDKVYKTQVAPTALVNQSVTSATSTNTQK